MVHFILTGIVLTILSAANGRAQVMDTTFLKNSPYSYYVVERNNNGVNLNPVRYFDEHERLGKIVSDELTVWRTFYDHPFISYRVFRRKGKNEWITPDEYYDENDNLIMTQTFKNEELVQRIGYDSLQNRIRVILNKTGTLIRRTHYDTLGNLLQVIPLKNGRPHGTSYTYHRNGEVEWTKTYRKGKLHGERVLRDSLGNLVTGEHRHEFPNSDSFFVTKCINGRPHGRFEVVSREKGLSYIGHYDHGFPHGEYTYFDQEGNVIRIDLYKNGKFRKSFEPYLGLYH